LTDKLFDAKNLIYHYKLAQEKEVVDGKLAGLLTALKDLDNLIESQRADKNKEGLGYSVVPPPSAQLYSSPKKDLKRVKNWTTRSQNNTYKSPTHRPAVPATADSLAIPKQTAVEKILTMSSENKAHYESEKEAIHLLLTGIRDEIYSTVDAWKTAHEMWIAIERLQQEWSRFVTIVKQQHDLDTVSYHKLFEVLKQYQKTSSNSRNKNVDITLRYKNDNQTGQFRNQRTMTVVGAKETVGSQVMQQTGIHCFNCKEFGHFAKECRKPKRVKDSTYHKEKMLLCKQAEKGVSLQEEQADWLEDTYEEIDEKELEAHYSFMEKIQEVPNADSETDTEPLEQDDSNVTPDSPNMCDIDIQINQNAEDKRAALANLIANLKLDVDENKKIQK
nr:hypothetical protein [Tanacetum cinerariifolium]